MSLDPFAAKPSENAKSGSGQSMRVRINDRAATPTYANAFRTNASAEEVVLDFGLDMVVEAATPADGLEAAKPGEVMFDVTNRVVINYFTAKRLAIMLGQIVQRHEGAFGELKLNVNERAQNKAA